MLQVSNIVIHNFQRLHSIYQYHKILAISPYCTPYALVACFIPNGSYLLLVYPYVPPPTFLSPLATSSLFPISVTASFCYIH